MSGETVLITGVTRGLGKNLTEMLCSKGVHVIGISKNGDELLKIKNAFPNFSYLCADLSDVNEVDKLLFQLASLPPVNAFILNAAVYDKKLYFNEPEYLMNVNYRSQVKIVNELIKLDRCNTFILMSSILAKLPDTRFPVYGESKRLMTDFILGIRAKNPLFAKSRIAYLGPMVDKHKHPFEAIYKSSYPDAARFIIDNLESPRGDLYYPRIWKNFIGVTDSLPPVAQKCIMKIIR